MKTYTWTIRALLPKKVRRKDEIRRNEVIQMRAKRILQIESQKAWEYGRMCNRTGDVAEPANNALSKSHKNEPQP